MFFMNEKEIEHMIRSAVAQGIINSLLDNRAVGLTHFLVSKVPYWTTATGKTVPMSEMGMEYLKNAYGVVSRRLGTDDEKPEDVVVLGQLKKEWNKKYIEEHQKIKHYNDYFDNWWR